MVRFSAKLINILYWKVFFWGQTIPYILDYTLGDNSSLCQGVLSVQNKYAAIFRKMTNLMKNFWEGGVPSTVIE